MHGDYLSGIIVNVDHGFMCATIEFRVIDRVSLFGVPEPTEWEHIGNEINAAMIFTRSDFVNVHRGNRIMCL